MLITIISANKLDSFHIFYSFCQPLNINEALQIMIYAYYQNKLIFHGW